MEKVKVPNIWEIIKLGFIGLIIIFAVFFSDLVWSFAEGFILPYTGSGLIADILGFVLWFFGIVLLAIVVLFVLRKIGAR